MSSSRVADTRQVVWQNGHTLDVADKFPIVSLVLATNNAQNNIYEMNCYQMHLDVEKVEHT